MAWERRGSRRYFYRSVRDRDGRVVKHYVGAGAVGERAAHALGFAKAQRQLDRMALLAEQATLQPADHLAAEFADAADLLMVASLLAEGYHHPRQGRWRKRRERPKQ
jgi:hypothetical protein